MAREVPQTPARGLLRRTARAAPRGVREARRDSAPRKKDAPHAHDGDDMLDRHPRIGARLRHSRGRPRGARRAHAQGQMPPHTLPGGARAQALALRGGASHSARPDIHRQDRQPSQPPPRMVRDEEARRARRRGCEQGVPAQPAPPLRAHLLRARARPFEARRPARPQQRRDDAPIHNHRGRRTPAPARQNEAGNIIEIHCTYDPETKSGSGFNGRKPNGNIHFVEATTAISACFNLLEPLMLDETAENKDLDFMERLNPNSLHTYEGFVEESFKDDEIGTHYQFVRNGYYILDKDSTPSHLVFNRSCELKSSFKL